MADNHQAVGHGQLSVTRNDVDGITVLRLHGEVDYQSAVALTRALPPTDPTAGHRIVIDLSQVTFMDSSGVNALIAGHRATQSAHGWLRLAGAGGAALRTVQMVGLDTLISCHPTVRDAVAA